MQIPVLIKTSMMGFHMRKYREIIVDSRAPARNAWVILGGWWHPAGVWKKQWEQKQKIEERLKDPVIFQLPSARAAENVTNGNLNGQV